MRTPPRSRQFLVRTDTATLAVFDETALAHRRQDDADWWSVEADVLSEVNAGNGLVCDLWSDGGYLVEVRPGPAPNEPGVRARLACPSGRLFVVEGEQLPAGGLGPDPEQYGATVIDIDPGPCLVTVTWGPARSCADPPEECRHPDVVVTVAADPGPAVNRFEREIPDLALPDV